MICYFDDLTVLYLRAGPPSLLVLVEFKLRVLWTKKSLTLLILCLKRFYTKTVQAYKFHDIIIANITYNKLHFWICLYGFDIWCISEPRGHRRCGQLQSISGLYLTFSQSSLVCNISVQISRRRALLPAYTVLQAEGGCCWEVFSRPGYQVTITCPDSHLSRSSRVKSEYLGEFGL